MVEIGPINLRLCSIVTKKKKRTGNNAQWMVFDLPLNKGVEICFHFCHIVLLACNVIYPFVEFIIFFGAYFAIHPNFFLFANPFSPWKTFFWLKRILNKFMNVVNYIIVLFLLNLFLLFLSFTRT